MAGALVAFVQIVPTAQNCSFCDQWLVGDLQTGKPLLLHSLHSSKANRHSVLYFITIIIIIITLFI